MGEFVTCRQRDIHGVKGALGQTTHMDMLFAGNHGLRCGRIGHIADLDYAPRSFGSAELRVATRAWSHPDATISAPEHGFVSEHGMGKRKVSVCPLTRC